MLQTFDTNKIVCGVKKSNGDAVNTQTDASISLNTWSFVNCHYNYTHLCVDIKGVNSEFKCTSVNDNLLGITDNPLYIGTYRAGGYYNFHGTIDEVRIWNSTLTATEIGYLYDSSEYSTRRSRYGSPEAN